MQRRQNGLTVLFLAFILFQLGLCSKGFRPQSKLSTSVFQCISQTQYKFGVIEVKSSPSGIQDVQNVINAVHAGINISVMFSPCRSRDPVAQALEFSQKVPRIYNGTVWINITFSPYSECSWRNADHVANCQYLRALTTQLRFYYLLVGITTREYLWNYYFNGKCNDLHVLPLLWQSIDGNATFENYKQFGNWTQPSVKQFSQGYTLCGAKVYLEYIPDWKQKYE